MLRQGGIRGGNAQVCVYCATTRTASQSFLGAPKHAERSLTRTKHASSSVCLFISRQRQTHVTQVGRQVLNTRFVGEDPPLRGCV